jgi:hypothetical protein
MRTERRSNVEVGHAVDTKLDHVGITHGVPRRHEFCRRAAGYRLNEQGVRQNEQVPTMLTRRFPML